MTITKQLEPIISKYGYKIEVFQISGKTWQADIHQATEHQPISMQTLVTRSQFKDVKNAINWACEEIATRIK